MDSRVRQGVRAATRAALVSAAMACAFIGMTPEVAHAAPASATAQIDFPPPGPPGPPGPPLPPPPGPPGPPPPPPPGRGFGGPDFGPPGYGGYGDFGYGDYGYGDRGGPFWP